MIGDQYAMLALREVEEDSGEQVVLCYLYLRDHVALILDDPPRLAASEVDLANEMLDHYEASYCSGQVPDEAIAVGPLWVTEDDGRRLHERYSNEVANFPFQWAPGMVVGVMGAFIERGNRGEAEV